jgi:hypothetical protein
MVRTPHPHAKVTESEVLVLDGTTHLVSAVCAKRHFAVLLYDIECREVIVYDGLNYSLKTWQHHITHSLKKYGLQRWNAKLHVEEYTKKVKGEDKILERCFDDIHKPWKVDNDPILKQHDSFNCGPIACLKVMEIYGILPLNSIAEIGHQKYGYRGVVMDYYKTFLSKHDSDLKFILNRSGFEKITRDGSVRKNELSGGVDDDEAQE